MTTAKRSGRPPKFKEARRPVTVTLPERTLRQLAAMHEDRAMAIVKLAEQATHAGPEEAAKPLEVVPISRNQAILLVGPSLALLRIHGLRLVEVAPSRFLLVVPSGTPVESLEVNIRDQLESLRESEASDRELLQNLLRLLGRQRRTAGMSKAELLLITP